MSGPSLVGSSVTILVILQTVSCVSVEIEDVTAKQFNAALQTETRIAVFWCKFKIK